MEMRADADATYDEDEEINLSELEPLIACPSSPDHVVPVRNVAGREIYQAYIGSSANPGLRDFAIPALMVEGTFRGASELLAASEDDPAELRRRVTSPKGTTERAIAVLEEARLKEVFDRATDAALARARELAAGA